VSLLLLRWALRGTDATTLLEEVRGAHGAPLLLAVLVATLTFWIRLFRWRLLLRADTGEALPAGPLWHAVAIGFMANNLLPFRAGEFVRCYTAARLTRTRLTAAISSVAVERVFDGLTVVALLALALFVARLPSTVTVGGISVSVARAATIAGGLSVAALAAALVVVLRPLWAELMIRRLVPWPGVAAALVRMIEGFRHGLDALRSPRRLAAVVAWSLLLWLVNAASFWIAFSAFDLPVGFAGALLLQGLLVFGIAVPSTPGYVGVFEAVISAVLLLYGVSPALGAAYALVYHATTFVPITLLGAWSLLRTGLTLGEIRQTATLDG
jgi:glycosyltransferase 2 family protein